MTTHNPPWLDTSRAASFIVAAVWFVHSNNYFGWHAMPQSDAELWSDLAMLALVLVAFRPRHWTTINITTIEQ